MKNKKNLILFSIIQSIPIFLFIFLLDIFKEKNIFSLKNILTVLLFTIINIIAIIFQVILYFTKKQSVLDEYKMKIKIGKQYKVMMILYCIILFILLFGISFLYFTKTLIIFPSQKGFVNDYVNVLTVNEQDKLNRLITKYYQKKYFPIFIVFIDNISYYNDPMKYISDLGNYWLSSDYVNSMLIGYCIDCKYICILPSKKLSLKFNSEILKYTLNNILIPEFYNKHNYAFGLEKAIIDLYSVAEALE